MKTLDTICIEETQWLFQFLKDFHLIFGNGSLFLKYECHNCNTISLRYSYVSTMCRSFFTIFHFKNNKKKYRENSENIESDFSNDLIFIWKCDKHTVYVTHIYICISFWNYSLVQSNNRFFVPIWRSWFHPQNPYSI